MSIFYDQNKENWGPSGSSCLPSLAKSSSVEHVLSSINRGRKNASQYALAISGAFLVLLLTFPEYSAGVYGHFVIKLTLGAFAASFCCGMCVALGYPPVPKASIDEVLVAAIQTRVRTIEMANHQESGRETKCVLFGGNYLTAQISFFVTGVCLLLTFFFLH